MLPWVALTPVVLMTVLRYVVFSESISIVEHTAPEKLTCKALIVLSRLCRRLFCQLASVGGEIDCPEPS